MKNKLFHLLIHKSHFRMNFAEHSEGSTIYGRQNQQLTRTAPALMTYCCLSLPNNLEILPPQMLKHQSTFEVSGHSNRKITDPLYVFDSPIAHYSSQF